MPSTLAIPYDPRIIAPSIGEVKILLRLYGV